MSYDTFLDESSVYYIYDGSFDGLLSVIYEAVYSKTTPSGIGTEEELQLSFNTRYVKVSTNLSHARRVYEAIHKKIGSFGMNRLYYVFLSDEKEKDLIIYKYMMLGFKNGEVS